MSGILNYFKSLFKKKPKKVENEAEKIEPIFDGLYFFPVGEQTPCCSENACTSPDCDNYPQKEKVEEVVEKAKPKRKAPAKKKVEATTDEAKKAAPKKVPVKKAPAKKKASETKKDKE